jgi:C-8 sterol isomerase
MAYIFEPEVLRDIVRMHMHLPIEQQFPAVAQTLREVYGEHVSLGERWMWSNAGGIMCAISPLHVSHNEYLLFCGTAIGSEGHSGRHRADIYDAVMAGDLWTYEAGSFERHQYKAGDLACLRRGTANGSKLQAGAWLLEYARGNVPSLFPFALGDTLFSTLDTTDLLAQLGISTRLMTKEAWLWLKQRRLGTPFVPDLSAVGAPAPQRSEPETKRPKSDSGKMLKRKTNGRAQTS